MQLFGFERYLTLVLTCAATCAAMTSCSTDVDRTNPFDLNGTGQLKDGRIGGRVFVLGAPSQLGWEVQLLQEGIPVGARLPIRDADVSSERADCNNNAGCFESLGIPPGSYDLTVANIPATNEPVVVSGIEVLPGLMTDVGVLVSGVLPPTGQIVGDIAINDDGSASLAGTTIVLTYLSGGVFTSRITQTDINGFYSFDSLQNGDYEVRCERDGFTPDLADVAVGSSTRDAAVPRTLVLYPASAVVRVVPDPQNSDDERYTRDRSVNLEMLAFGGFADPLEMRYSESPDLTESGSPVDWTAHVAVVPYTLSAGEGEKTIYVQFRVVNATSVTERLRTDIYSASIVFDESPPELLSFVLAPNATVLGGQRYVTPHPGDVPVEVRAFDPYSTVAGVRLIPEAALSNPTQIGYDAQIATDAAITYYRSVPLELGDGNKTIGLQLIDRAGNETTVFTEQITIDETPPAFENPSIFVRDAVAGEIHSALASLQFLVGTDAARMRYGVQPLTSAITVPFTPEVTLSHGVGHMQTVQFEAVAEDALGNGTTSPTMLSPVYTVNLRGSITGTVALEDGQDALGVSISVRDLLGNVVDRGSFGGPASSLTSNADANGVCTYGLDHIPPGSYEVVLNKPPNYVQITRGPIDIRAGQASSLGAETMVLARGGLFGFFKYGDKDLVTGNHGGIAVIAERNGNVMMAAITDATGRYGFGRLPVGNYSITGSAENYLVQTISADVVEGQDSPVNGSPTPVAVVLGRISGAFKICDQNDPTSPTNQCQSIPHTRKSQVLLGITSGSAEYVRFRQEQLGLPGRQSFTLPDAAPADDLCSGGSPNPDCWATFDQLNDPDARYLADVTGEGRLTIVAQLAIGLTGADVLEAGTAQIVHDTQPPLTPSIAILRGADALIDGYTRQTTVAVNVQAVATTGPSADAAPLSHAFLSSDAILDRDGTGNPINGDVRVSLAGGLGSYTVVGGEGEHTIYAWFCDAADNCTELLTEPSTRSDSIIYDISPPIGTLAASGNGVTQIAAGPPALYATRSIRYTANIGVGTAPWGILPDVAAFRMSRSNTFVGSAWTDLDLDAGSATFVAPESVVDAAGIELPPIDNESTSPYNLWAEFKDAAGNHSAPVNIGFVVDTRPPGGTVAIENNRGYASTLPLTILLSTDSGDPAVHMQYSWNGVLPAPDASGTSACDDTIVSCPFASTLQLTPPDTLDGTKTILVRLFDAAGNYSERSAAVVLDRTPPELISASATCVSCVVDDSDTFYTAANNVFSLFAADNSGVIDHMDVNVAGTVFSSQVYAPQRSFDLPVLLGPGPHAVTFTFFDPAGNSRIAPTLSLTYDEGAPTVDLFRINGTDDWTASTNVTVNILASDANGVHELLISNDSNLSDAVPIPFVSSMLWNMAAPGIDERKTVYVQVVDAAGRPSAITNDFIDYDHTPPTMNLSLQGEAVDATTSSLITNDGATVTVNLGAADNGAGQSGLADMRISNLADFSGAPWEGSYAATQTNYVLLNPTIDGVKIVFAAVRDAAGNVREGFATIVLDRLPPTGIVSLNSGVLGTQNETNVSVAISASSDTVKMALVEGASAACAAEAYVAFNPNQPFGFTPVGDGEYALTVCLQDAAGNYGSATDTILVDTTVPYGSVRINGASSGGFTNTANVTVSLSHGDATSGVSGVRLSNDPVAILAQPWETTPALSRPWTLDSDGNGTKSVYMQVLDNVGLVGPTDSTFIAATITLDTQPPSGTITIVGGNHSKSATVSVTLTRNDDTNTQEMALAQGSLDCSGAPYVSYNDTPPSMNLNGTGTQTVSLCLRDTAGNTAGFSTQVDVDPDAPTGNMTLNGDATFATNAAARLSLSASADVTQMRLPVPAECTATNCPGPTCVVVCTPADCSLDTNYETYTSAPAFNLGTDQGDVTVRVCVRDAAKNFALVSDSIILDTTGPVSPSISIESDGLITNKTTVDVEIGASDVPAGVAEYKLSDGTGCSGGAWTPFTENPLVTTWILQPGDNVQRSISVRFRDAAGNESAVCQPDSIDVDTVGPEAPAVSIARGANATLVGFTNDPQVTLNLFAVGAQRYEAALDPTTFAGYDSAAAMASTAQFCLLGGATGSCTQGSVDQDYTVFVIYYDVRGTPSDVAQATIRLDTVAPVGESLDISVAGSVTYHMPTYYTRSEIIGIEPGIDSNEVGPQMQFSMKSGGTKWDGQPWLEYAPSLQYVLLAADCVVGVCTISARYRDLAGNRSSETQTMITLDLVAPIAPKVVLTSDIVTHTSYTFEIVEGIVADEHFSHFEIKGGQYADFTALALPATTTAFPITLSDNQTNTLRIRAVDLAGNVSTDDFSLVTHDDQPPVRPAGVKLEAFDGELRVQWSPSTSSDVEYYLLYYGTLSGVYIGTGAAEGASPINVGLADTINLTGLANDTDVYVALSAVDAAGNESALSAEASNSPSLYAAKLLSQIGGSITRVWANPDPTDTTTDFFFVPTDGGLQVRQVNICCFSTTDRGFIPNIPDPTQILFDGDLIFVHSSDPELGPVESRFDAEPLLQDLPNENAPVRVLTTYRFDGSSNYTQLSRISLPDNSLFFELADDGAGNKMGISGTLGLKFSGDEAPDFTLTASELSYWAYDAVNGAFTLETTETVQAISGWALHPDGRHLILNDYQPGFYKLIAFFNAHHSMRVIDPFGAPVTDVGAHALDVADDGLALAFGPMSVANNYVVQAFPAGGIPIAPMMDVSAFPPVSYGHYRNGPTEQPDPAVGTALDGDSLSLDFDPTDLGSIQSFAAPPLLNGHTITIRPGAGDEEIRTIASYTLPFDGSAGTYTFDLALDTPVAAGTTFTVAIDATPGRNGLLFGLTDCIVDSRNYGPEQLQVFAADPQPAPGPEHPTRIFGVRGTGGADWKDEGCQDKKTVWEFRVEPTGATYADRMTEVTSRTFADQPLKIQAYDDYLVILFSDDLLVLPLNDSCTPGTDCWQDATGITLPLRANHHQLLVNNGFVYTASRQSTGVDRIEIIDATDPTKPTTLSGFSMEAFPPVLGMVADGNRIYVLQGECDRACSEQNGRRNCDCFGQASVKTFSISRNDMSGASAMSAAPRTPITVSNVALPFNGVGDLMVWENQLLVYANHDTDGNATPDEAHLLRLVGAQPWGVPGTVVSDSLLGPSIPLGGAMLSEPDWNTGIQDPYFGLATSGSYVFVHKRGDRTNCGSSLSRQIIALKLVADDAVLVGPEQDAPFANTFEVGSTRDDCVWTSVRDMQIVGNYLYVFENGKNDGGGLRIYDISAVINGSNDDVDGLDDTLPAPGDRFAANPFHDSNGESFSPARENIVPAGFWAASDVQGGTIAGSYAYVILSQTKDRGEGGLRIVDISDPEGPTETASIRVDAEDVHVEGGLLYVSTRRSGLRIYQLMRGAALRRGARYSDIGGDMTTFARAGSQIFGNSALARGDISVWRVGNAENHQTLPLYRSNGLQSPADIMRAFGTDELWSFNYYDWGLCSGGTNCLNLYDASYMGNDAALTTVRLGERMYTEQAFNHDIIPYQEDVLCNDGLGGPPTEPSPCCSNQRCQNDGTGSMFCQTIESRLIEITRGPSTLYFALATIEGNDEGIPGHNSGVYVIDKKPPHTLFIPPPLPNVLLCGADGATELADVSASLAATGLLGIITTMDCNAATPSVATLTANYDAVLVWEHLGYADATGLGDNLADFADAGGGVVVSSLAENTPILGRLDTEYYMAITGGSANFGDGPLYLLASSSHPILRGVTTFSGGTESLRNSWNSLNGAEIARWDPSGESLVATKELRGTRVVSLNLYPVSDAAGAGLWDSTTDGGILMANALVWAANLAGPPRYNITGKILAGPAAPAECNDVAGYGPDPSIASINDIVWHNGVLYTVGTELVAMQASDPDPSNPEFLNWAASDPNVKSVTVPSTSSGTSTVCIRGVVAAGTYLYAVGDENDAFEGDRDPCFPRGYDNADGRSLWIFDISVLMAPAEVSRLDFSDRLNSKSLAVDGNTVYLGDASPERILMVDVSDRVHPFMAGSFNVPGTNNSIEIYGPDIFIHGGNTGVNVLDGR
ncbi:MAG: hypothetical protein A2289_00915 [Deltaproteobacteria bacterium RIFOXYA12_FULL_58_15]|nr:MAG: hypothetical protein A2289_00915 [Deltaproteobacteria bacterium RIFOXYA12_FULL_58_15]